MIIWKVTSCVNMACVILKQNVVALIVRIVVVWLILQAECSSGKSVIICHCVNLILSHNCHTLVLFKFWSCMISWFENRRGSVAPLPLGTLEKKVLQINACWMSFNLKNLRYVVSNDSGIGLGIGIIFSPRWKPRTMKKLQNLQ